MSEFLRSFVRCALIVTLGVGSAHAGSAERIHGTWVLERVLVRGVHNSDPRGIARVKYHYAPGGKLYLVAADGVLKEPLGRYDYTFDGETYIVTTAEGDRHEGRVSFPDAQRMLQYPETGAEMHFIRLDDEAAVNRSLVPYSVHEVVGTQPPGSLAGRDEYDARDHSRQPLSQRIVGLWEVVENRGVRPQALPPYGFLNDLWRISPDTLRVQSRGRRGMGRSLDYRMSGDELVMRSVSGEAHPLRVAFDSWGRLVLTDGDRTRVLLLVDKDETRSVQIPLRITLLGLRDSPRD